MWNLAVYLPLIIGEKVPNDDNEWECHLLLLDVLQICTSRVLSHDLVDHLRVVIQCGIPRMLSRYEYNSQATFFLLHLPTQILKLVEYL